LKSILSVAVQACADNGADIINMSLKGDFSEVEDGSIMISGPTAVILQATSVSQPDGLASGQTVFFVAALLLTFLFMMRRKQKGNHQQ
jgi:hypothetical protein